MHIYYAVYMRTTLDLPEEVIEAARAALGFKSKTDTVVYALKEVIRKHHVQGLTGLLGKVHIELDLDKARGRQPAVRGTAKA
jgi:Arc/MetJ family transcription regulator